MSYKSKQITYLILILVLLFIIIYAAIILIYDIEIKLNDIIPALIIASSGFIVFLIRMIYEQYKKYCGNFKNKLDNIIFFLDEIFQIINDTHGRNLRKVEMMKLDNNHRAIRVRIDWFNDDSNIKYLKSNQKKKLKKLNSECSDFINIIITIIFTSRQFRIPDNLYIEIKRKYYNIFEIYQYLDDLN